MIRAAAPTAAALQLDAFTWRPATAADAVALHELASLGANRTLFDLPASADEFAGQIGAPGFRIPMLCSSESKVLGAAAVGPRSQRHLNVQMLCFFADPVTVALPMAAYVRHLFWLLPLHRVYAQLPMVDGADDYMRLLAQVGFTAEGVIPGRALIDGRPQDVAVFGLLRREFDAWCLEHEPRLAL